MYCPVCGCELPAIARFCVRCGSRTAPGSLASPSTSSATAGTLFCVSCGHPYESSHRFCNGCGRTISSAFISSASEAVPVLPISTEAGSSTATAAVQQLDRNETPSTVVEYQSQSVGIVQAQPAVAPPYATFVAIAIASALAASVIAFTLADGAARGQWTAAPVSVISTVLCLIFLSAAIRKAGNLRSMGGAHPDALLRRRKLVRRSMFFAALFIGTAVLVGTQIGASGAETNNLISDIDQMSRLGDRISNARNAAERTVSAQVEMYKSIEPDVERLSLVLTRLREEYATYDSKYPSQHETVTTTMVGVEKGAKRMNLLRQQITIAKEIANVDDADGQFRMWQTKMQPLLDRENELDSTK